MRPMVYKHFEKVRVWCCMAVEHGQMDQHMVQALSFRCGVGCFIFNKGQIN